MHTEEKRKILIALQGLEPLIDALILGPAIEVTTTRPNSNPSGFHTTLCTHFICSREKCVSSVLEVRGLTRVHEPQHFAHYILV